jgi:hypothetical protein
MPKRLVVYNDAVVFGVSGLRVSDAVDPVLKFESSRIIVFGNMALELDPYAVLSIPQAPDVFGTVRGAL